MFAINKRQRNPETLATLVTQDTGRRKKKKPGQDESKLNKKHKTEEN